MFSKKFGLRRPFTAVTMATVLTGATVMGAAAAPPENVQRGGAAGVVAAVVQVADTLNENNVQVGLVNIGHSLNNLRALNNVLNNSPVLSHNNVVVTDVVDINNNDILNDVQITALNNFLNDNDIDVNSVIGVAVLSTGDLIVLQS